MLKRTFDLMKTKKLYYQRVGAYLAWRLIRYYACLFTYVDAGNIWLRFLVKNTTWRCE